MKAFSFNRFLNVARWDLSVNCKFYTRSSLLMVAIMSMPIVLYYLYSMLNHNFFMTGILSDNVGTFSVIIAMIGCAYTVISSGYMFHNLLTKQGRISELTLPATNLERFLWHVVVIVIGVQVVFFFGVLFADVLHSLFRLAIPGAEIKSLTTEMFNLDNWRDSTTVFGNHLFGVNLLVAILLSCYCRSFCLVNAWKYRYNIPLTFLIYFVLNTVLPLLLLFIGKLFLNKDRFESFIEWIGNTDPSTILVWLNIFAGLIYVGIWLLTYRLYTRAQLTTKRNP
jgi:hypothetical protein